MTRKWLAVGIILLFVGVSIAPAIAQNTEKSQSTSRGNWLYVGGSGPGNYTRIQDAIDNASDGDTVFVYDDSSPYYENVFLIKSISIIGENRDTTIIDANGYRSVLVLEAEDIVVTGFTLQHSGGVAWNDSGIRIKDTKNAIITHNIFINNGAAILCRQGNTISITDNVILDNEWGIRFSDWDTATIADNIINNSREGIRTNDCINIFIYNNKITNHSEGIVLCSDEKIEVHHNYIENNVCGIGVCGRNALIYNNIIIKNIITGMEITGTQNIIKQNNLIENTIHATFAYERREIIFNLLSFHIKMNTIIENYWDDHSSSSPKQIEGKIILWSIWDELEAEWKDVSIAWHIYDKSPAQEPHDIEV